VAEAHPKIAQALRWLASGGMADEDADLVRELLTEASELAKTVLADPGASTQAHQAAERFLADLHDDAYETYG
jgi:hypothetical protein